MERSFSVGAAGTGNTIKLYTVALPGATDINGVDSLAGKLDRVRPTRKTLLLDLDDLGIPLDNVEGMTSGPPARRPPRARARQRQQLRRKPVHTVPAVRPRLDVLSPPNRRNAAGVAEIVAAVRSLQ